MHPLKKLRRRITYSKSFIRLAGWLGYTLISLYFKTLKITIQYHDNFCEEMRHRVLFGFWHGRQFLLVPTFGVWQVVIMTDLSWAGSIQTEILQRFGYIVVRGSSKRKGVRALLETKRHLEAGHAAAIALDGPRGPIYQSKPGIAYLSKKTGFPIVPVATACRRKWILKNTWCQYEMPKPFSRCVIAFGRPMGDINPETPSSLEKLNQEMITLMKTNDKNA